MWIQSRSEDPSSSWSWYLIECNSGNCFLVAVHKKPIPGCNQCRHINIITGVSGYQCLGVFRSCPGGGRCGLRSPVTEWRMMQRWGENSAAVYGVARGRGHMFRLFPVCLPWISLQMYVGVSFECHLTLVLASPPLILDICFAEFSHHQTRHRPAAGVRSHGRAAEFHRYPSPVHSARSWYLY